MVGYRILFVILGLFIAVTCQAQKVVISDGDEWDFKAQVRSENINNLLKAIYNNSIKVFDENHQLQKLEFKLDTTHGGEIIYSFKVNYDYQYNYWHHDLDHDKIIKTNAWVNDRALNRIDIIKDSLRITFQPQIVEFTDEFEISVTNTSTNPYEVSSDMVGRKKKNVIFNIPISNKLISIFDTACVSIIDLTSPTAALIKYRYTQENNNGYANINFILDIENDESIGFRLIKEGGDSAYKWVLLSYLKQKLSYSEYNYVKRLISTYKKNQIKYYQKPFMDIRYVSKLTTAKKVEIHDIDLLEYGKKLSNSSDYNILKDIQLFNNYSDEKSNVKVADNNLMLFNDEGVYADRQNHFYFYLYNINTIYCQKQQRGENYPNDQYDFIDTVFKYEGVISKLFFCDADKQLISIGFEVVNFEINFGNMIDSTQLSDSSIMWFNMTKYNDIVYKDGLVTDTAYYVSAGVDEAIPLVTKMNQSNIDWRVNTRTVWLYVEDLDTVFSKEQLKVILELYRESKLR